MATYGTVEVGGGRGRLVLSRKPPRLPLHRFITVRFSQGQTAHDCYKHNDVLATRLMHLLSELFL